MSDVRRRLGASDLSVFPINLGGNVFGWTADEAQSFRVLDAYRAGGGNFVDSADSYSAWVPGNSGGESETILGSWLERSGGRDDVVIATKVSQHPQFRGLAPDTIRRGADASLARLRTDRIDLYYAHRDDEVTPIEDVATAFSELVDAGKVRYIGISNFSAERIEEWLRVAEANGLHRPVALQPHYNLVEREFETTLRPLAERENLAVVPYYALASGFLTGKYRDSAADSDSARASGAAAYLDERGLRVLAALDEVAAAHSTSVTSVSLAWLAAQPTVAAPIASARTPEQVPDLLAAATLELTPAEIFALSEASAR
jgi:aryl-alcohol dehydrogenase-like predicted oxidoreductase